MADRINVEVTSEQPPKLRVEISNKTLHLTTLQARLLVGQLNERICEAEGQRR